MAERYGRKLSLSLPRRFVGDLIHFAEKVPSIPTQRCVNVAPLVAARKAASPRTSWCSIFTKAYALVAAREPVLRQAYIAWPWPHLYEHRNNVAVIAIERRHGNEDAVFCARMREPEKQRLEQIDAFLHYHRTEPVENIGLFRRALRVSTLPRPLRRLAWRYALDTSGYRRVAYFGTFGVSAYSGTGSESLYPRSPLTTTLTYGVIGADGSVNIRLVYDHRVLDGATVGRALASVEEVLHREILAELRGLAPTPISRTIDSHTIGHGAPRPFLATSAPVLSLT